jgi:chromate transport protein ChrA
MKKTARNIAVFAVTFFGMTACALFDFRISSIIFIFTAGIVGLSAFLINKKRKGAKK